MNSKNYLVWAVVALVVVLGGYYLIRGYSKPAENTSNVTSVTEVASPTAAATGSGQTVAGATVDYTDSGFAPKSITVKVGDTVTWTNKSSSSMWIASNPHPTHTDLPGFDELSSVSKGGTYSYTFAKAGNWKYHNHLSPQDSGVIVVQ